MKDAIKPNYSFKLPSITKSDQEAEKKGATEEERMIFAMTQMRGWQIMEEYIENLSSELNEVNKTAIQSGAPLEEIGRNTVIVSLTQDIISKILNKASDSVEACTKDEQ